jgi:hypothetical protein
MNGMIRLLLLIVIVGVALYLVENYVPMSPPIKVILRVVAIIFLLLVLLRFFGLWV